MQVVRDRLTNVDEVNTVATFFVIEGITTLVEIVNQLALEGGGLGEGIATRNRDRNRFAYQFLQQFCFNFVILVETNNKLI